MKNNDLDESYRLFLEIEAAIRLHDLRTEQSLDVLASVAVKILCNEAPDRQTADEWTGAFGLHVIKTFKDAANGGDTAWSRLRVH